MGEQGDAHPLQPGCTHTLLLNSQCSGSTQAVGVRVTLLSAQSKAARPPQEALLDLSQHRRPFPHTSHCVAPCLGWADSQRAAFSTL